MSPKTVTRLLRSLEVEILENHTQHHGEKDKMYCTFCDAQIDPPPQQGVIHYSNCPIGFIGEAVRNYAPNPFNKMSQDLLEIMHSTNEIRIFRDDNSELFRITSGDVIGSSRDLVAALSAFRKELQARKGKEDGTPTKTDKLNGKKA